MWQAVSSLQSECFAGTARMVRFHEHHEVLASPNSRMLPFVIRRQPWRHTISRLLQANRLPVHVGNGRAFVVRTGRAGGLTLI